MKSSEFLNESEQDYEQYIGKPASITIGGVRYPGRVEKVFKDPMRGVWRAKCVYSNEPGSYFYKDLDGSDINEDVVNEGDDKSIEDVQANHPDVYAFLNGVIGAPTLRQLAVVEAYNTANSHMVRISINPSAGIEKTEVALQQAGMAYEAMTNPMGGGKVLSGSIGEMHWTVSEDRRTEVWLFALPHKDDETQYYSDRTMEEDMLDEVDEGEPRKEKLDLHSVFGSDAANALRQEGIKFYEKPSYWSDLERGALGKLALRDADHILADAGLGDLAEYPAWQIFAIDPDRSSSYVKGPLQTVENMPAEKVFVIHDLPYSDERRGVTEPKVGTFLVDTQGAETYIRSWLMIK